VNYPPIALGVGGISAEGCLNNNWAVDAHGGMVEMAGETIPFYGAGVSFAVNR